MPLLNRGDLLAAAQCPRRAWLQLHPPEDAAGVQRFPRADDRDAVRDAARRRFPGGRTLDRDAPLAVRLADTAAALADPEVPAVYDATFVMDSILVRAAILERVPGGWIVAEAKAANSVGEAHEREVGAVAWVAAASGVPIVGRKLLHLDSEYVRGAELDEAALFTTLSVPERDFGPAWAALVAVAEADTEPEIAPGPHCLHPRECPFRAHCSPVSGPYAVARLPRAGRLLAELAELGVDDVRRIPTDVRMNPAQQHAVWALVNGREYVGQGLRPTLENVRWPLRFLDFEACQPAVPRWAETSPFQQLPTQWSMHVQHEDGRVEHLAFLHRDDSDPREPFVRTLVEACGTEGTIVVYSSYEATTLRALRDRMPELWTDLEGLISRLFDLLPVVRDHYYHPALDGSFSIKVVLPAVCPEIDYHDLTIADGASAAQRWLRMIHPATPAAERDEIAAALLAYCERDTFAMLKVREALLARSGG